MKIFTDNQLAEFTRKIHRESFREGYDKGHKKGLIEGMTASNKEGIHINGSGLYAFKGNVMKSVAIKG